MVSIRECVSDQYAVSIRECDSEEYAVSIRNFVSDQYAAITIWNDCGHQYGDVLPGKYTGSINQPMFSRKEYDFLSRGTTLIILDMGENYAETAVLFATPTPINIRHPNPPSLLPLETSTALARPISAFPLSVTPRAGIGA